MNTKQEVLMKCPSSSHIIMTTKQSPANLLNGERRVTAKSGFDLGLICQEVNPMPSTVVPTSISFHRSVPAPFNSYQLGSLCAMISTPSQVSGPSGISSEESLSLSGRRDNLQLVSSSTTPTYLEHSEHSAGRVQLSRECAPFSNTMYYPSPSSRLPFQQDCSPNLLVKTADDFRPLRFDQVSLDEEEGCSDEFAEYIGTVIQKM